MNVAINLLCVTKAVLALSAVVVLVVVMAEMINLNKRIREKVAQIFIDETNADISRAFGLVLPCVLLLYLIADGIIIIIKSIIGGT